MAFAGFGASICISIYQVFYDIRQIIDSRLLLFVAVSMAIRNRLTYALQLTRLPLFHFTE